MQKKPPDTDLIRRQTLSEKNRNLLAILDELQYNHFTRHRSKKAGREALPTPHAPMQEKGPPTQQKLTAPEPILPASHRFYKWENRRVCSFRRCRDYLPCAACVVSTGSLRGREWEYHPPGSTVEIIERTNHYAY